MRLVIIDFSPAQAGWGELELARLRAAAPPPRDRIELFRVQAGAAVEAADPADLLRRANELALPALLALDISALDSSDGLLVNAADAAHLLALHDWYKAMPSPRPTLTLRFTRDPDASWISREPLPEMLVSQILALWSPALGLSVRMAGATPEILQALLALGLNGELLPDPASEESAAGLLAASLPAWRGGEAAGAARVLFFAPFGHWMVHHQLDAVLSKALSLRGGEGHVMACDGLFNPCVIDRDRQNCETCQLAHRRLFAPFGTPESRISDWLSQAEIGAIERWADGLLVDELPEARFEGIPAGDLALSNLFTHFRISSRRSARHPDIVGTHRRFVAGAAICYRAVERAIRHLGITSLFLFNGRMYPYAAALQAAQDLGLKVIVHERGTSENSFGLFDDASSANMDYRNQEKAAWSAIPLDQAELDQVDHHLTLKLKGRGVNFQSFYAGFSDLDQDFFRLLDLPRDAKLVGYFTTSPDEICLMPGYGDVAKQFDVIDQIADLLGEDGYYLIVRHHPAIGGGQTLPPELDGLGMAYRQIPEARDNVRVIMPNDPIPSSALYPHLDAAIAMISSVGLELMACGVPTLCGPAAEMTPTDLDRFPFVMKNLGPEEVVRGVREVILAGRKIDADFYRHCLRSIYEGYERKSVHFKAVSIRDIYYARLDLADPAALTPGYDPLIDHLCEVLAGRAALFAPPDEDQRRRSDQAERAHAEARIALFRQSDLQRAEARAAVPAVPAPPPASDLALLTEGAAIRRLYGAGWRQDLLTGGGEWLDRLTSAIESAPETWIWVGADSFVLHGIFATRALAKLAVLPPDQVALPLTGWFELRDQFRPIRLSTRALTAEMLRELSGAAPGLSADIAALGLAVWRRDHLLGDLLPALRAAASPRAAILDALAGLAGSEIEIAEPIFLNQRISGPDPA